MGLLRRAVTRTAYLGAEVPSSQKAVSCYGLHGLFSDLGQVQGRARDLRST